jgi:glycosyltransferase involved in cell wall biosynthesis
MAGKGRILMLLETDLRNDERVKKECITLAGDGFEVHVLFPVDASEKTPDNFVNPGVFSHPFPVRKSSFNKLMATCLVQPFYFRLWKKKALHVIDGIGGINAVYIHDLPLSAVGLSLKKRLKIPVICDQHEYYSDWIVRTQHMNTFTGKLILALGNWKKYERKCLTAADLVISVTDELCDAYRQQIPAIAGKLVSLPNTPLKRLFKDPSAIDQQIVEQFAANKAFRAIYVGANISSERGLHLLIDALPLIRDKVPDIRCMILGRTHRSYDILAHIEKNAVGDLVEMIGWVPNEMLPSYLACSSVGLNLHETSSDEANKSIFTKIFQYIAMNLAIVSTDGRLMADLITQYDIGTVTPETPEALAEIMTALFSGREQLLQKQKNTEKLDTLFWETTSAEWLVKVNLVLQKYA